MDPNNSVIKRLWCICFFFIIFLHCFIFCSDIKAILQCIHDLTKDCLPEELGTVESTVNTFKSLADPSFGCSLELPPDPPICEPEPECNSEKAVACFELDEFTDVCR